MKSSLRFFFAPFFTAILATSPVTARGAEALKVSPQLPAISERTFNISEFGAVADGSTINTRAFRAAVEACAQAGGGRIEVPAGDYVAGPFALKSSMELHLAKGAILKMSPRVQDFPVNDRSRQSFISATDARDVQITGEGTIDGQGQSWWAAFNKVKDTPKEKTEPRRPQLIAFERCERIRLQGFTTLNPPNTHCSIRQSREVTIEGLTMLAPGDSPNTDALNLNVHNAAIRRCHIATGDDNIVFLASAGAPGNLPGVENVSVEDCALGVGHGLSVGSYTAGGIRNIAVENVTFDGTTAGIRLKAARGRGGLVANLTFNNIRMKNVNYPIYFTSYYPKTPAHPGDDQQQAKAEKIPQWRNITIANAVITDCPNSLILWGLPEQPISDVTLRNVSITAERGAMVYHAKQIHFDHVTIQAAKGAPLTTFHGEVEGSNIPSVELPKEP